VSILFAEKRPEKISRPDRDTIQDDY